MIKNLFFDIFPVPNYLNFPLCGLDLCENSIRYVELFKGKDGLAVKNFDKKLIDPDTALKNPEGAVMRAISDLAEKFDIKYAHVALPEDQSYYVKLHVPLVKRENLREAIELQLEEHVPYSVAELVFDYDITEEVKGSDGYIDVNVSVLPISVIDKYLKILEATGITPVSFEVESESILRSIVPEGDKGTFMIVKIGAKSSVLSIVNKGIVWFSLTIKTGGDQLTDAIAQYSSVSREEAEKIKFTKGLSRAKDNEETLFCLAPIISSLRDEIIKHYWYWNANKKSGVQNDIEKVIICGSEASINGLPEYLSASLEIPVSFANPWVNVLSFSNAIPEISEKKVLEYTTAIGLALKGIKREEK